MNHNGCVVSKCTNNRERGLFTCKDHTCPECFEQKRINQSICTNCKCQVKHCYEIKITNKSIYCQVHACPNCKGAKRANHRYCSKDVCNPTEASKSKLVALTMKNNYSLGSSTHQVHEYAKQKLCGVNGCDYAILVNSNFCSEHTCRHCSQSKIDIEPLCRNCKCEERICDQLKLKGFSFCLNHSCSKCQQFKQISHNICKQCSQPLKITKMMEDFAFTQFEFNQKQWEFYQTKIQSRLKMLESQSHRNRLSILIWNISTQNDSYLGINRAWHKQMINLVLSAVHSDVYLLQESAVTLNFLNGLERRDVLRESVLETLSFEGNEKYALFGYCKNTIRADTDIRNYLLHKLINAKLSYLDRNDNDLVRQLEKEIENFNNHTELLDNRNETLPNAMNKGRIFGYECLVESQRVLFVSVHIPKKISKMIRDKVIYQLFFFLRHEFAIPIVVGGDFNTDVSKLEFEGFTRECIPRKFSTTIDAIFFTQDKIRCVEVIPVLDKELPFLAATLRTHFSDPYNSTKCHSPVLYRLNII